MIDGGHFFQYTVVIDGDSELFYFFSNVWRINPIKLGRHLQI